MPLAAATVSSTSSCRASVAASTADRGDVAGIGDVLWLRSRAESERQGERIERLRARTKAPAEPVADIDGLRAEIARLRSDAEAWEEIATDQERSYSDATAKVDELTRTVQRLEGEKRALERKAAQCAAPSDDDGAARVAECLQAIPRDLADLLKLARSIWPDRIVVLPEAMDSAKSYDGNLAEEWDIVRGAATALYGLLFEDDDCEGQVADEFQRRTGYELTFSESSATRARADLMKMRERSYGGRTVDISAHIKGRSQKNTFRLHFYIDRENELIVIGHAGMPHEDRRLAPSRFQVAQIPGHRNRWRGSFLRNARNRRRKRPAQLQDYGYVGRRLGPGAFG